ncbi:hypothetical protein N7466_004045 [Penicillium verhagenii]|uniref:uncharacterized protein n=1 Tax=Penicillium verhagenii TaxID=1562060 RepID=UPI0025458FA7|nr:uncharacterized protein N7466_004045 [Penicillium verhagenii]KAJ5934498.1 hypothetical protein N7466_004045 [Penicillium verhagenii]
MTQSTSHRRSPSAPHTKSKLSRPALHRRGTSALNVSISKLGAGSASGHTRASKDDDEFDMAASFLNFCAMCENQITVPNNSILYCSESCRRKDSCKPLSASLPSMSNMSSMTTTPPHSPPLSPRTIVAPMTPTRPVPGLRIPENNHDGRSDLDPTEWKPVLLSSRSSTSLASSDAWNYLSQFHGGNEALLARRAARSTSSLPALVGGTGVHGATVPPSLTNTPSTVASSFSSTASDDHELGLMYSVTSGAGSVHRPLPPRHNPYFGSMTAMNKSKGVDLVVPHLGPVAHDDVPVEVVDSADVWEDAHENQRVLKTAPISMVQSGGSARLRSA